MLTLRTKPEHTGTDRVDKRNREHRFLIRVTAEEREAIERAATAKSLDASAWARSEGLALAKKINRAERPGDEG